MAIEVIEDGVVERCQAKHPILALQCDHFADHFGSHQHAVSPAQCMRWPSEDDVEDAHAVAEIEAMSDEECEAYLIDEENGVTRETVRDWGRGAAVFAKAMVAAKHKIESLTAEVEGLRSHPFSDVIENETAEQIAKWLESTDVSFEERAAAIRAGAWRKEGA